MIYYPIEIIGEGCGGEVVKVKTIDGEIAAIKIIEGESIQEYNIGMLAGDIGPTLYSYTQIDKNLSYILMENIEGNCLDEILVTREILENALDAYYSLYINNKIIQNDFKAQNIIYTKERKIKILDYGSAIESYSALCETGAPVARSAVHSVTPCNGRLFYRVKQAGLEEVNSGEDVYETKLRDDTQTEGGEIGGDRCGPYDYEDDIETHMIKMTSLLLNSLTFEYNKYNTTEKENIYFNISNVKEENTYYFLDLYNSAIHWLNIKFNRVDLSLKINYDEIYIDINIIGRTNPEIPLYKLINRIPPVKPSRSGVIQRRKPLLSSEHIFVGKNRECISKTLFN
jgi:serine/threonine protein kinase